MFICIVFVACNDKPKVKETVIGTVGTVDEENRAMSVYIDEGTVRGTVRLGIPEDVDETFNVGDKVKVGFDGTVMESAPAQIIAITLEKIK